LNAEHGLQFLQVAAKWQESMIHWPDRPSLSFALMAVSCEALKPSDADRRNNCYDVIEALLGKVVRVCVCGPDAVAIIHGLLDVLKWADKLEPGR
jgi:hypothetical protein